MTFPPLFFAGACVMVWCGLLSAYGGPAEPAGAAVGTVQFDAIIELDLPLNGSHGALFARYWVAPRYYRVAVAWAEPRRGEALSFSVDPPSLSLCSDEKSFSLSHDIYTVYDTSYPKPVGARPVFDYRSGDYAIPNLRFADAEATGSRVLVSDLDALSRSPQWREGAFTARLPTDRSGGKSDLESLRLTTRDGGVSSLELIGPEDTLRKRLGYEYEAESSPLRLRRLNAWLPEEPVELSLRAEGVHVKMNGTDFRFKQFQGTLRPGGRAAVVEYAPVTLGGKILQLPVRVEVRGGKDNAIRRSARFTNFRRGDLFPDQIRTAAAEYGGLPSGYRRFSNLADKCQHAPNHVIPAEDAAALRELRAQFEGAGNGEAEALGLRLRRLSVLLETDRLLRDNPRLRDDYHQYLSTLADAGLPRVLLLGGYGLAAHAAFRGDPATGDQLLRAWVERARQLDPETMLQFLEAEIDEGEPWPALLLLEGIQDPPEASLGVAFEWAATRYLATEGVLELLSPTPQPVTGYMKAQADLARVRATPQDLQRLLPQRLADALDRLRETESLTAKQAKLRDRLRAVRSLPSTEPSPRSPSPKGTQAVPSR